MDADPAELWPLVANTDSLNRELGLPPVTYEFQPQSDGGTRVIARASSLGQTLEWVEHPFEWVAPMEYAVEREFTKGPFRRFVAGTKLVPQDGKTRVEAFAVIDPKGVLGNLAVKFGIVKSLEGFGEAAGAFEQFLKQKIATPYPRRCARVKFDEAALAAALGRLGTPVPQLSEHLRTAPDEQVARMRPFELADRWKTDRIETLRTFLRGTRAGLVDMTWNVVCPTCRGVKAEAASLKELHRSAHCNSCNIRFEADFDRAVEVRFTVNPSIRRAASDAYCIGGPRNTPHVLAQQRLKPGERREIRLELPPGRYVLRSLQSDVPATFEVGSGSETLETVVTREACLARGPVQAGPVRVVLANEDRAERVARIESAEWTDTATTAALVTTLQEFRDLFATEFLAPGEELSIKSLTFLFTDLKGSTSLYEQVGDASAYVLVREHFRLLSRHIREHCGAVVKTMGDAVMATFFSPEDAVRASIAIQREVAEQARQASGGGRICIKIGLHAGPCIAVTSNERLDYFGTSVNLSQRVQSESGGGDLTMTEGLVQRPAIAKMLADAGARVEPFEAMVKGFAQPVPLFRAVFPWTELGPGRETMMIRGGRNRNPNL